MNEFIAYCGLDCEKCEARIATMNNDDALRQKVAKEWSVMNEVEITPEMINCTGCRVPGVKFPFCESMCPIKICSSEKKFVVVEGAGHTTAFCTNEIQVTTAMTDFLHTFFK